MCGIVGYIGSDQASPILLEALRKLEYRGYDSAGIAVVQENHKLQVRKIKGRLSNLELLVQQQPVEGMCGIGHTRWATHGDPSDINSHPHTDVSGNIAVVHNGIIENHASLKLWLENHGVVFRSQTDSEVIAHLVDFHYNGDLLLAVMETVKRLEGSYAIAVVCEDYPDRMVVARKDSPLVIGIADGCSLIASDVPPLLGFTREVQYLNENELAVLKADSVKIYSIEGEELERETSHIDWDIEAAEKCGYEHFMLKEIFEQPKALADTLSSRIKNEEICLDPAISALLKECTHLLIVGCGSAYHAGMVAKYVIEHFAGISVEVDFASELRYRTPLCKRGDVCIVISQSGETADTLASLRLLKSLGVKTIALTNVVGSTISREADLVMYTQAGPEIAVASTKALTTQLMCLYLIAMVLEKGKDKLLLVKLKQIPSLAQTLLDKQDDIQRFAARQFNKNKVFFMGRLTDYAISMESALKLKEISYTHSESFAAGELKHGPIALVDESTLVVAMCTHPSLYRKMDSNIKEVKARGATALVITFDNVHDFDATADEVFRIPETEPYFTPMLTVIVSQLYAYYCSVLKGNDPDKPRNLAKSVTVE
ncbi:glutamine--fructose-6-phosphate transaminase (isomerizing) [uncultured Sphaerochaeta sp.]|uniref:glutamine--fructose-6-phosphate transaminase (isomerizing) n=1 Tax=uncultured Sphaerochaeta sp. TaxID=886478 RepID=UPI002A0A4239|nr:glutamine--fructose-6-phosphate transaminase (isomerizing) [uncultured Sphaerochaeta sp.]